jgi:DNA-binding transcriptional ArsR family regulator
VENRDDDERRADALLWFQNHGVERDESAVLDDPDAHADAALGVFAVLAGDDLGNDWERAVLPDGDTRVARNRRTGQVSAVKPPELTYASGVVALDGTPTQRLWELSLGERLNHRQVLSDAERREYVRDGLNLNLVRTTEYVKPYNSADHVAVEQDAALLEAVHDTHGEKPSVVTTATAETAYEDSDAAEHVADTRHYGNVLGSNELREKRVGAVVGSNHYGDDYLKRWGAFAGEAVDRNDEKGADLSYGSFGDDVHDHMTEHETLQAAMRFGRDGNGAVVYVHTDTLPEWVPVAAEGRVRRTWSDGMREVLTAAERRDEWTTAELADAVDLSTRQVREHLHRLVDDGVVECEYDGSEYVWRDDGLHRVNENGAVELEPVDDDELRADESAEVARMCSYTWDFRGNAGSDAKETTPAVTAGEDTTRTAVDGGTAAANPPD